MPGGVALVLEEALGNLLHPSESLSLHGSFSSSELVRKFRD